MNIFRQIWIVSVLNFKSLPRRFWQSLVIVVGMACVIGVLLSMLSLTTGMAQAYVNAGDPGRAIVVSAGAETEGNSAIPRDQARIISDAPGIARDASGAPLADFGLNLGIPVIRANGSKGYTTMRGMTAKAQAVRPEIQIVAGRMFRPGRREMIVGIGTQSQFQGMAIADKVILPDGEWPIVGIFKSGDLLEGQLIGDTDTMMTALKRKTYNTVLVRLTSPAAFSTFKRALTTNPALSVTVERHSDWYKKISDGFATFFTVIAYGVGIIMAIGALFGCLNTMYAAISTRGREIATLRAIGYGAFPVAVSVILEAMALSVTGALIGAAFAWSLYNGVQDSFGNSVFKLTVSPTLIGIAVLWAFAVALLGGILPSIRAARRPVVEALRAT